MIIYSHSGNRITTQQKYLCIILNKFGKFIERKIINLKNNY